MDGEAWFGASTRRRRPVSVSRADRAVVRLSGEITSENAERVARHLLQALRARPVVLEVDLEDVTYLSSDGCAAFFTASRTARTHGTRVIVTVRRQPHGTLTQVGLRRALDVYEGDAPPGSSGSDQ